jgi:hypothetical protein
MLGTCMAIRRCAATFADVFGMKRALSVAMCMYVREYQPLMCLYVHVFTTMQVNMYRCTVYVHVYTDG